VLAGPNGSGKSSLFDAFLLWRKSRHEGYADDHSYYRKGAAGPRGTAERVEIEFSEQQLTGDAIRRAFYFRSAYRNDPEFNTRTLEPQGDILEERRVNRMIESDAAVSVNYRRLASQAFEDAFASMPATMTLAEFREKIIGDIKDSVQRLFPDLILNTLGNPFQDGTFRFDKGTTRSFDYKNLSGGEKAAFDLLLDLIVKRKAFSEAIYCIDEPDAHMNTRLQGALLQELYDLLPEQTQLWVATHSIGMMRKARELFEARQGAVSFLDFGDSDFDQVTVIEPSPPTRAFWQKQLGVALDDLARLVAPREVVICEGSPAGPVQGKNAEHDALCYDTIFSNEYPDIKFLSAGNASDVARDQLGLMAALPKIATGIAVRRLIDRDDHAPADVARFNGEGITVLARRNLESYLYDDEILTALCNQEGKPTDVPNVLAAAEQAITASINRGNPPDDLKSAAGDIFNATRRILQLVGRGNDARAFARSTLAPLVAPGTFVYHELKRAIFG